MNRKTIRLIRSLKAILILAMFAAALSTFDQLPEQIPTHWNAMGIADDFNSKSWAAYLMPSITIVMAIMLRLVAFIDPRRKNYEKFKGEWEVIQFSFVAFMAYFYFTQLYIIMTGLEGPVVSAFFLGGMGILFITLGRLLSRIKSNFFVGIRTPWTIEDPIVWEKTHELGGRLFMAVGAIFFALALWPRFLNGLVITGLIFLMLVPVLYSYLEYRKRH